VGLLRCMEGRRAGPGDFDSERVLLVARSSSESLIAELLLARRPNWE
jgi:hypothetical protein